MASFSGLSASASQGIPQMDDAACVICKERFEDSNLKSTVVLTERGSKGINYASTERGDDIVVVSGQKVHTECRRFYCKEQNIVRAKRERNTPQIPQRRNSLERTVEKSFSFGTDCMYCGTEASSIENHRKLKDGVFNVTTLQTKDEVLRVCEQRRDTWSEVVQARILHVHDLPAADAIYHQSCSVNFRTGKQIPKAYVGEETANKKTKTGRPQNMEKCDAFLAVANYLKANDEDQLLTIGDLCTKMEEYLDGSESSAYGSTHMKDKLKKHFDNQIIITEINGRSNVVIMKTTADAILQDFHAESFNKDPEAEKRSIIQTAAKLIKHDIKGVTMSGATYPDVDADVNQHVSFMPQSLQVFLQIVFAGKHHFKLASIGQAVMQAARPRALIAPLQIGLAVQLHHCFASRFLIDSLNSHGFCSSYTEVQKFSKNAAVERSTDIPSFNGEFVQYSADNVDHNIRTLDGRNTFHGMGMIAAVTPGTKNVNHVPRNYVDAKEISAAGHIQIVQPVEPRRPLEIRYNDIAVKKVTDPSMNLDVMWKMSLLFDDEARTGWSGMMQTVLDGIHQGKSSVFFLPMIDMSASDITCIYSTLKFLADHAQKHNVSTPIVTFDQPLWWKAFNLIQTEPEGSAISNMIVRLGGLHDLMSFLGAIGKLMGESGLRELLELVYASNAVDHILTGKAIARAIRGHLLVDAALNALLYAEALEVTVPQLEVKETEEHDQVVADAVLPDNDLHSDPHSAQPPPLPPPIPDGSTAVLYHSSRHPGEGSSLNPETGDDLLEKARLLFKQLLEKEKTWEEVNAEDVWEPIRARVQATQETLRERSRTSALWLQYMEMINIVRTFIKAERTANWELHLQAMSQMLPYLAAAGHNHYVKSVSIYLQFMSKLEHDNPEVYRKFMAGLHVVRRSDRYWAGLSTDLIIEQVLMRTLKTSGGLTRGRGMTEQQRLTWLLAMPTCADVNDVMQELTGVNFNSSEQNKDLSPSRKGRDVKDTTIILRALHDRSPFSPDPNLRNTMNGVNGDSSVNVYNSKEIGEKILTSMTGRTPSEYTFRKVDQAITLAAKSSIKIDGERVEVDPQLLFQRLILASSTSEELSTVFRYELSSYPTSLFDSSLMLRQANKPALADAIWSSLSQLVTAEKAPSDPGLQIVLDGGALLHRVLWPNPGSATFSEVCARYCDYVTKKYGKVIVVFDGYTNSMSSKQMTQRRRASGKVVPAVTFTEDMQVTMRKDVFLSNSKNKQRFLYMLSRFLQQRKCETHHADGDADLLIVKTAVESARSNTTVLVGDDTDLLILLLFYGELESHDLFFIPEPKSNSIRRRVWNIKKTQDQLGRHVCENILYIHAVLGCDTTSRIHGIGKGKILRMFERSSHLKEHAQSFQGSSTSKYEIATAGESTLVLLYNGKPGQRLDDMRYQRYQEKLATKTTKIEPNSLPPTSAAARYHSFRVYAQVQQWRGAEVNIEEWGWKSNDGQVIPVMTDLPPAPESLLRIVRCNCSTGCGTMRCSCRKHSIECSPACGQCKGSGCQNSSVVTPESDDSDEE